MKKLMTIMMVVMALTLIGCAKKMTLTEPVEEVIPTSTATITMTQTVATPNYTQTAIAATQTFVANYTKTATPTATVTRTPLTPFTPSSTRTITPIVTPTHTTVPLNCIYCGPNSTYTTNLVPDSNGWVAIDRTEVLNPSELVITNTYTKSIYWYTKLRLIYHTTDFNGYTLSVVLADQYNNRITTSTAIYYGPYEGPSYGDMGAVIEYQLPFGTFTQSSTNPRTRNETLADIKTIRIFNVTAGRILTIKSIMAE